MASDARSKPDDESAHIRKVEGLEIWEDNHGRRKRGLARWVVNGWDARTDRFTKMREYHEVSSIKRYVLVEQTSPVAVSYTREGNEPWAATPLSIDDVLTMPEIGVEIPVSDIFDGISLSGGHNVVPLQPE